MRYFAIFLILIGFAILFIPHVYASCILLPCDDANIELGEPNYRFIDFSYQNKVGKPITFILEKTSIYQCNSYIATITNENGDIVWTESDNYQCNIAENSELVTSQIKLGYDANNPIIMSESSRYLLEVQIDDGSIEREFAARHHFSGISIDRTVYPVPWEMRSPLKQIKSGIQFNEIQCKEGLELIIKSSNDSSACVSPETKQKLIQRGWAESLGSVVSQKQSENIIIPDNAVLQVTADAPCAWMTLQELPHSELLKQHDRTGRNALMLEIDDDDMGKVPHLKEMLTTMQSESGFEPYEYDENTWQKRINSRVRTTTDMELAKGNI